MDPEHHQLTRYQRTVKLFAHALASRANIWARVDAAQRLASGIIAVHLTNGQYALLFDTRKFDVNLSILAQYGQEVITPTAWDSFSLGCIPGLKTKIDVIDFARFRREFAETALIPKIGQIKWLTEGQPIEIENPPEPESPFGEPPPEAEPASANGLPPLKPFI